MKLSKVSKHGFQKVFVARHMASKLKLMASHGLELNGIFGVCSDVVLCNCACPRYP